MTQFPWSRVQIVQIWRWTGDHWERRGAHSRVFPEAQREECLRLFELLLNTKSGAGTEKC